MYDSVRVCSGHLRQWGSKVIQEAGSIEDFCVGCQDKTCQEQWVARRREWIAWYTEGECDN